MRPFAQSRSVLASNPETTLTPKDQPFVSDSNTLLSLQTQSPTLSDTDNTESSGSSAPSEYSHSIPSFLHGSSSTFSSTSPEFRAASAGPASPTRGPFLSSLNSTLSRTSFSPSQPHTASNKEIQDVCVRSPANEGCHDTSPDAWSVTVFTTLGALLLLATVAIVSSRDILRNTSTFLMLSNRWLCFGADDRSERRLQGGPVLQPIGGPSTNVRWLRRALICRYISHLRSKEVV